MTCVLSPVSSLPPFDGLFYSSERQLVVCSDAEGNLRIYKAVPTDGEYELVKEISGTGAPILTVQFAPLIYRNYLLVVSIDRRVALLDLDNQRSAESAWSYHEENKDMGNFTCAAFHSKDKSVLAFSLGTSTGAIMLFSTEDNFEPRIVQQMPKPIISITAAKSGEVAVAVTDSGFYLFLNEQCSTFINFQADKFPSSKNWTMTFGPSTPYSSQILLAAVGKEGTILLWDFDSEQMHLNLLSSQKMEGPVAGGFWSLSGLSLNLFIRDESKDQETIRLFRARDGWGTGYQWTVEEVRLVVG
jgi:WD40 repeat protein